MLLRQRPALEPYPPPVVPEDNPITAAKVALGELLFTDGRLSVTGSFSCASCHRPDRHFTDARPLAIGATGERHTRHTPTLYNVAFNASFGWDDAGLTTLEAQHLVPLFNTEPVEMGFDDARLAALRRDANLIARFAAAFEVSPTPAVITTDTIVKALASYVRTLRAPTSAFDRYLLDDDRSGMSEAAFAGLALFFSERLGCSTCHASLNFSGPVRHAIQTAPPVFHVTAVGGTDEAFRAPTLRAVAHTAPYMHDGSLKTLAEVVAHYQTVTVERVPDFTLSEREQAELIAFLTTL